MLTAMQVEHELDAVVLCPADSLADVVVCAVHVRSALATNDRPITDWQTSEVQANGRHLFEIGFRDPGVPVVSQAVGVGAILLAVGVFYHLVSFRQLKELACYTHHPPHCREWPRKCLV